MCDQEEQYDPMRINMPVIQELGYLGQQEQETLVGGDSMSKYELYQDLGVDLSDQGAEARAAENNGVEQEDEEDPDGDYVDDEGDEAA